MSRLGAEPKPTWQQVPRAVRRETERALGAPVRRALRVWGGYAPSATFRLFLADGRRAIFKGVHAGSTDYLRTVLRNEERVYRELGPFISPWAPAFYGALRLANWHALLLEDVGRARVPPWTERQVRLALRDYAAFHASTLGRRDLPGWLSRRQHHGFGLTWQRLQSAAQPGGVDSLASLAGPRSGEALAWLNHHLPRLRTAAEGLARVGAPYALLHFDTRSDNLRLSGGGRLRLFDWPYACLGPPEFDVAAFVQSIAAEGGPEPERSINWYAESIRVREAAIDASIAALAGYFAWQAWQPPLPGLPRLRWVQRQQLRSSLAWCSRRLGLPEPEWVAWVGNSSTGPTR